MSTILLIGIGIVAGVIGNVAGVASMVSYPALLAFGLPPIIANATNSVANTFGGIGAILASGPELRGQRRRVARLSIVALAGGLTGGLLLLVTPQATFVRIVPWLIAMASVTIVVPVRPGHVVHSHGVGVVLGIFVISVYCGFFGAAAGVLATALLLHLTRDTLARCNAKRTVLLAASNAIASLAFTVSGVVRWSVMVPLSVGFFLGGAAGPVVTRRSPVRVLRFVISALGIALAAKLAIDAY